MAGLTCLAVLTACGGGGEGGDRADVQAATAATAVDSDRGPAEPSDDDSPFDAPTDPEAAVDVGPRDVRALRIVLTWDDRPSDLDAHLTGPVPAGGADFHVFSGNREAGTVRLVEDATTGNGPETVEIDRTEPGVYRYAVFNFSGDADRPLDRSGARVEVFSGDASLARFAVPAGVGNLWTVFDIDDARIVAVDTIAPLRNVLDYFPPEGREPAPGAAAPGGPIP